MMTNLNPYHGVTDREKVDTLVSSMIADGWVGAPVVVDGYSALTGVHRLAAADRVNAMWETGESDRRLDGPTIEIHEVWEEAEIAEDINEYLTYEYVDEYVTICQMIRELAPAVAESYGLDIH
jgi:hypothetical protein